MRAWFAIFLLSAPLWAATPAPAPQSVAGAWVDSQCNVYDFAQSGATLRIEAKSWKFDAPNAPTIYEGPLDLKGIVGPNGFEADQRTTGVRLTGGLREKWIDAKLLIRGESYQLTLCPRASKLVVAA